MSFAFMMMMFLSSSVAMAFVLHPAKEEPAASAVSHHRCQSDSLQAVRKNLLAGLNLQTEPQLPAGVLDSVREQWSKMFSPVSHRAATIPAADGYSVSPDSKDSASLKCCSTASEIFMKDLGWDSWVIHPQSLTIVQCSLCTSDMNTVQCPPSHSNIQDANSQDQVPCCQPTSQEMVNIVYMDESSAIVVSSVQLTRSCGCGHGSILQPNTE
ncbi:gonadal somatic cell derived factor [Acanthochromis polyacanthus]|uniref:Bone morphogenetic protein 7-like n=1 Tax=Acanthochromis polyacanthus TaxID=80966 RepID=A0A3Q1G2I7_9TELE|nr:gonadal somatic cell derived factor [Acanthochromis polyacanthus]